MQIRKLKIFQLWCGCGLPVRADYERDIEFIDAGASAGACCGCGLRVRAKIQWKIIQLRVRAAGAGGVWTSLYTWIHFNISQPCLWWNSISPNYSDSLLSLLWKWIIAFEFESVLLLLPLVTEHKTPSFLLWFEMFVWSNNLGQNAEINIRYFS